MNPTIARMRAAGGVSLPRRSVTLYLAQGLVARGEALDGEYELLKEAHDEEVNSASEAAESPSRKAVDRVVVPEPPARLAEIDAEREAIYAEMRDYRSVLEVEAESGGAWRRWADDHPAREGNVTDKRVGRGIVDIAALYNRLGEFMRTLDGEAVSEEDKAYIMENAAPGTLTDLCKEIVFMQEGDQLRPKASPIASSSNPTNEPA